MKRNESHIKKLVKEYLRGVPDLWYYMPVSIGMGAHGIPDFIGTYKGKAFFIETKAPGRRGEVNQGLSGLQVAQRKKIEAAGGGYFIVDGEESLTTVIDWVCGG